MSITVTHPTTTTTTTTKKVTGKFRAVEAHWMAFTNIPPHFYFWGHLSIRSWTKNDSSFGNRFWDYISRGSTCHCFALLSWYDSDERFISGALFCRVAVVYAITVRYLGTPSRCCGTHFQVNRNEGKGLSAKETIFFI